MYIYIYIFINIYVYVLSAYWYIGISGHSIAEIGDGWNI